MATFKQWIARIFNIRVSDLTDDVDPIRLSPQVRESIQDEVNRQVQAQLEQSVQKSVIPVIQQTISEQFSNFSLTGADKSGESSGLPEPGIKRQDELKSIFKSENVIDSFPIGFAEENFPVIDEPEPVETNVGQTAEDDQVNASEESVTGLQTDPALSAEQTLNPEKSTSVGDELPVPEEKSLDDEELPVVEEDADADEERLISGEGISENEELPVLEEDAEPEAEISEEEISPLDEEVFPLATAEDELISPIPLDPTNTRIGIDFGTTTTAVSIKIGDALPVVLPIGSDGITLYMPSIVYFEPGSSPMDERAVVGEEAESYGDEEHVIRSIKRCLGCQRSAQDDESSINIKKGKCPYPWCRGYQQIDIGGGEIVKPEKIVYLILREAVTRAVHYIRETRDIDITTENICSLPLNMGCGANFNLTQRKLICGAAKELGFQEISIGNIVEEPILAGFTFSRFADQPEGRILIYDFGGGTFDVALLDVDRVGDKLRVTVIATTGENWLGGDDIDSFVYEYFLNQIARIKQIPVSVTEEKLGSLDGSRLRILARKAKEFLSNNDVFTDTLFSKELKLLELTITRNDFEELLGASEMIQQSFLAVERACKLAYAYENAKEGSLINASAITKYRLGDAATSINRVILVGGVTRTPLVRSQLIEIFGQDKIIEEKLIDPISAVAFGGAYPHDSQHYSISVPPFGFYLEYEREKWPEKKFYKPVFEPYEYYDFHKYWVTDTSAVFFKDLRLTEDHLKACLCSKMADTEVPFWKSQLGNLVGGKWRFSVSLDGTICYAKVGGSPKSVKGFPIVHPIQKAIQDAKTQRHEQEQQKKQQSQGTYEEMIKSTMYEN